MARAKERLRTVLQPDLSRVKPPLVFPIVVANHAAWVAGERLSRALTDSRILSAVLYQAYRLYNYDLIMVFADVLVEAEAMGCEIEMAEDEPPILVRAAGQRAQVVNPVRACRMPMILDATEGLVRMAGKDVYVLTSLKGPFSLASFLAGPEEFFEILLSAPERAAQFLRLATENQKIFAREIVKRGGVPFIGDPMASGSVISPALFERFALPYLKELVAAIHQLGSWTGLHICGDTTKILRLMCATGAEIISVDEMDIGFVRQEVGADRVIMGNVSTGLLESGRPEQIYQAAQDCLKKGLPKMILASACDVPTATPVANVQALVSAAQGW
ncbi:MAG: hypothetical protein K6T77_04790 [candidate division WOR-3 bacterium]|nr:hypothetical protein [candidate division WOR-3 bacterium]MCR4424278.1 hypothetical protein [candidate division WOR-3 bacterium]MDH7519742.1 uroporphyrinogen decarboxylase family protein [bacterium]